MMPRTARLDLSLVCHSLRPVQRTIFVPSSSASVLYRQPQPHAPMTWSKRRRRRQHLSTSPAVGRSPLCTPLFIAIGSLLPATHYQPKALSCVARAYWFCCAADHPGPSSCDIVFATARMVAESTRRLESSMFG